MLPVPVVACQDHALGARNILKKVDPRVLQSAANKVFPYPRRRRQKKWAAEHQKQAVESHPDLIRLVAVDIGKMFLQVLNHLLGGNGHPAIVKQCLRHGLDHQRL